MSYKYLSLLSDSSQLKNLTKFEISRLRHEIRQIIIDVTSKNGGHLASNLGMVELTLAMHMSFNSPKDKFVFDVSHQTYVHKLLTGRYPIFDSLRTYGGMSGFTKKSESPHDIFEAGHASTSLSAAHGLAVARDIMGKDYHVVALIGDGALSGGLAFEGLNNIGHSKTKMIIILNDNEMSISKNVGSLNHYLARLRTDPSYYKAKEGAHHYIEKIPAVGKSITHSISKVKDSIKQILVSGMLFEELGLTYIGIVDGHDIDALMGTFEIAKQVEGPVIIHVKTIKGKGLSYAEAAPENYHGVSPATSADTSSAKSSPKFSKVFGDKLTQLAGKHPNICAITAAMPAGTGLTKFSQTCPNRYFDVGIAEGHATTFAAGLATAGLKPYFAVYSTFLQRAYDHLVHDVCIQKLPVTFCIDRAGLVGNDGATHHGAFDLSFLLSTPNMMVMAPKNGTQLMQMLDFSVTYNAPLAIRYPRGTAYCAEHMTTGEIAIESKGDGDDYAIIAVGTMTHIAEVAQQQLAENGIKGKVIQPPILKPLDINGITNLIGKAKHLFTVEDNAIIGGFGSYLSELMPTKSILHFGLPDNFVTHGDVALLYQELGIDAKSIAQKIAEHIQNG